MEIKLKSALKIRKQPLLLTVRAAIFAVAAWTLAAGEYSLLRLLAFYGIALALYIQPVFNTTALLATFLVFVGVTPLAMSEFGSQLSHPLLLAVLFGGLFYILLGIKQFVFVRRLSLYRLLHGALLYVLLILFFATPAGDGLLVRQIMLWLAFYFLLREQQRMWGGEHYRVATALYILTAAEFIWAIGLLPVGFIAAASAALVFIFILEETLLTKRMSPMGLIVGGLLLLAIGASAHWGL